MTIISPAEQGSGLSRRDTLGFLLVATASAIPLIWYLSRTTEAGREIERNKSQKRIAIVDDAESVADLFTTIITRALPGTNVSYYPTCQPLLKDLESGLRYNVYIVDFNPGDTDGYWGNDCTREILIRDPKALVIGQSTDDVAEEFIKAGAREFISSSKSVKEIVDVIRSFLP